MNTDNQTIVIIEGILICESATNEMGPYIECYVEDTSGEKFFISDIDIMQKLMMLDVDTIVGGTRFIQDKCKIRGMLKYNSRPNINIFDLELTTYTGVNICINKYNDITLDYIAENREEFIKNQVD